MEILPLLFRRPISARLHVWNSVDYHLVSQRKLKGKPTTIYPDETYLDEKGDYHGREISHPRLVSPRGFTRVYDGYFLFFDTRYPFDGNIVEILDGMYFNVPFSLLRIQIDGGFRFRLYPRGGNLVRPDLLTDPLFRDITQMLAYELVDNILFILDGETELALSINGGAVVDTSVERAGVEKIWTDPSVGPEWRLMRDGNLEVRRGLEFALAEGEGEGLI